MAKKIYLLRYHSTMCPHCGENVEVEDADWLDGNYFPCPYCDGEICLEQEEMDFCDKNYGYYDEQCVFGNDDKSSSDDDREFKIWFVNLLGKIQLICWGIAGTALILLILLFCNASQFDSITFDNCLTGFSISGGLSALLGVSLIFPIKARIKKLKSEEKEE